MGRVFTNAGRTTGTFRGQEAKVSWGRKPLVSVEQVGVGVRLRVRHSGSRELARRRIPARVLLGLLRCGYEPVILTGAGGRGGIPYVLLWTFLAMAVLASLAALVVSFSG